MGGLVWWPAELARPRSATARLSTAAMRALDHVPVQLCERNERLRVPIIDIGAYDVHRTLGRLLLADLEHVLGVGRADRDHHDAAGLELLQKRRWNMVDAAGDNDLVEWGFFLP